MALPPFDPSGNLPIGVHSAPLSEVAHRFGEASGRRRFLTERLIHLHQLARETGHLARLLVFGSYVTTKAAPNDVDVILVMDNDFQLEHCPAVSRILFDHGAAQQHLSASVFWVRPAMLVLETIDQFLSNWQRTREGDLRGIVEIVQ
jgi:hypothetical protein